MSYVVISSYENIDTGDMQAEGEAVAVFSSEADARLHFANRSSSLAAAMRNAREFDAAATFITWLVVLRMPLDVTSVEEALEDLEMVIEETESFDDPFGELVIEYQGSRNAPEGTTDHAQQEALRELEAWLS